MVSSNRTIARWIAATRAVMREGSRMLLDRDGTGWRAGVRGARRRLWHALRQGAAAGPTQTVAGVAAGILGAHSVTILDAGARWGVGTPWYLIPPLARVVGFDPDEDECRRLNATAEPGHRYVPVALGARDGTGTLYVTRCPGSSSLLPPDPHKGQRFPSLADHLAVLRTLEVPVRRVDTWAADADCRDIVFIKADVQGTELDVLRGAGALLDGCLGLELEVEFAPLYQGQALFAEVDQFVRAQGFELWRLENLVHYAEHPSQALTGRSVAAYDDVHVVASAGPGRLTWAVAIYLRPHRALPATPRGLRDRLVLAALEEGLDAKAAAACLREALDVHTDQLTGAAAQSVRDAILRLESTP